MQPFAARPLADLLDALASTEPVPAGVSAAALAGASGVALLMMASALPRTRHGTPEDAAALASAAAALQPLRAALVMLVDRDVEAYGQLTAAFRQAKDTDEARAQRAGAIDAARRRATDTPLGTMRAGREALGHSVIVAAHCARAALADVGTAVELLLAAVKGAAGSIDANLAAMKDRDSVALVERERLELERGSAGDAQRARARLEDA